MTDYKFTVQYFDDSELVAEESLSVSADSYDTAYTKAEKKANREKEDFGANSFILA